MIGYLYFGKEKTKKKKGKKNNSLGPIETLLYTHVASLCRGHWHAFNVTFEGSVKP
jgi:hypothetical protein